MKPLRLLCVAAFTVAIQLPIAGLQTAAAQQTVKFNCQVGGDMKGLNNLLVRTDKGFDTIRLENGKASFEMPVNFPDVVWMTSAYEMAEMNTGKMLFMLAVLCDQPGEVNIHLKDISRGMSNADISGLSSAVDLQQFNMNYRQVRGKAEQKMRLRYGRRMQPGDDAYNAYTTDLEKQYKTDIRKLFTDLVGSHKDARVSTYVLSRMGGNLLDYEGMQACYQLLGEAGKSSADGLAIQALIKEKKEAVKPVPAAAIGRPVTAIVLPDAKLPFTLDGQIDEVNRPAKIVINYVTQKNKRSIEVMDTVALHQGKFSYKGAISHPVKCMVYLVRDIDRPYEMPNVYGLRASGMDAAVFYLDKGHISLKGKNLAGAVVTGSAAQDEVPKVRKALVPVQEKMNALSREVDSLRASPLAKDKPYNEQEALPEMKAIGVRREALEREKDSCYAQYIKNNPDAWVGLMLVEDRINQPNSVAASAAMFRTIAEPLRHSLEGRRVANLLADKSKLVIGSLAPDFMQNDTEGQAVKLSSMRGKFVLVDFWASWCGPCRAENPFVKTAYERFKDKNFEIIGVSLDDNGGAWRKAIKTDGLPWVQVSDLKGWNNEAAVLYQVKAIPQNWLLNPAGRIIAQNLRGDELQRVLEKELVK